MRAKNLPSLPRNFPYHHHKAEGKKNIQKGGGEGERKKLWKYNKKIFLLISLQFFASPLPSSNLSCLLFILPWKDVKSRLFLSSLTPTQATHFPFLGMAQEDDWREKNHQSHLNRITSLIVYPCNVRYPARLARLIVCVQSWDDSWLRTKGRLKTQKWNLRKKR